jgi:hypothetical protein
MMPDRTSNYYSAWSIQRILADKSELFQLGELVP